MRGGVAILEPKAEPMEKDCWKNEWVRGKELPGGNQGHTFLARKRTDPDDQFGYVLKRLKRQDDKDRRARVYIEVTSLRVLDHPGVAKLVDTNADDFEEDVELYLVTEHIQGTDLEGYAEGKPIDLRTACDITCRILEILNHCHGRGVKHRDIKPCHVILRDGCVDDPVLIDFGLAFTEEVQLPDFQTAPDQGVGNRFIILAEQMSASGDKRDERSDITQCVGILFYLLTRQNPGLIRDGQGRKPHQRVDVSRLAPGLKPTETKQLQRIFEIGFEWSPTGRSQSVDALSGELDRLRADQNSSGTGWNYGQELEDLRVNVARSPETELLSRLDNLRLHTGQCISKVANQTQNELSDFLYVQGTVGHADRNKHEYHYQIMFIPKLKVQTQSRIALVLRLDDAELVIDGSYGGVEIKPTRIGVFDPEAGAMIDEIVQRMVLDVARHILR